MVYTLYVVSDAYLGLDQQYDLCLEVVEGYEEVRCKTFSMDLIRSAQSNEAGAS